MFKIIKSIKKLWVRITWIVFLSVIIFCGCLSYCLKTPSDDGPQIVSISEEIRESSEKKAVKDIIQYFKIDEQNRLHFIVQMDNITQANLRNNEVVHLKRIHPLTDISPPSARLFVTDQKSEDTEKVSPAFIECLLGQLGNNWYLDWSSAINDFRPLGIKLQKNQKENNIKYLFDPQDINLCSEKSFERNQVNIPSILNDHLIERFEHFLIDRFKSEYDVSLHNSGYLHYFNDVIKQLAFMSTTDFPGVYDIYYFDENLYGSFLLRRKTAWQDNLNILVPQAGSEAVLEVFSQIMNIKEGVAVFNSDEINGVVSEQMAHRSGKSGLLTDQEKMAVNRSISNEIFQLISEQIPGGSNE